MKITASDIIASSVTSLACIAIGVVFSCFAHSLFVLPHGFQAIYLIVVFSVFFYASTLVILFLLKRFFPFTRNEFDLDEKSVHSLIWKLFGYLYINHLWLLINANMVPVNLRGLAYNLIGANIGRRVMVGGKLIEPTLITIGDDSMLGEDCILTAHTVVGNHVALGQIVVGRKVTVGGKSVILPDVVIGDGAIVTPGAVVKRGSRISSGEIWGGVPAKIIGVVPARDSTK